MSEVPKKNDFCPFPQETRCTQETNNEPSCFKNVQLYNNWALIFNKTSKWEPVVQAFPRGPPDINTQATKQLCHKQQLVKK